MIRELFLDDINNILPLLKRSHREATNGIEPFNDEDVKENMEYFINDKNSYFYAYFKEENPVGVIGATLVPSLCSKKTYNLREIAWHSDPLLKSFKRGKIMIELLLYFRTLLKNIPANTFYIVANKKTVRRKLLKYGFKTTGTIMVKEL